MQAPFPQCIIGTRGSPLALWQSHYIAQLLQQAYPQLEITIRIITTTGDLDRQTPLPHIGGKGVFTAELEQALQCGDIHLAVHSLKDMPTTNTPGLAITAIPVRANAHDVLISRHGYTWHTLPYAATVGSSSTRRKAQLLNRRPDLHIVDIRGNIDSRITKAHDTSSGYDAIVLAHAGVQRLALTHHITHEFTADELLPAPGQGALAVQTRDSAEMRTFVAPIHHRDTAWAVACERAVLNELGGGCSAPVAAYATWQDDQSSLALRVWIGHESGGNAIVAHYTIDTPSEDVVIAQARNHAQQLLQLGAAQFLLLG